MKKIMFVLSVYEIGGVSTVARNLLESIGGDGLEKVLMVETLNQRHYPPIPGVRIINLNLSPKSGIIWKLSNIFRHFLKIRANIIKEVPDVILSFSAPANCHVIVASLLINRKKKPKIIISEHTEEIVSALKPLNIRHALVKAYYRFLMFFMYPLADNIVTVSANIASGIKKKILFVSSNKIKVIRNPVDVEKIRRLREDGPKASGLSVERPCIGTVTRLSPEKGTDLLLLGFKALLERIEARLVIVGDGPEKKRLESLADELGLAQKVVFTGWVEDPFRYLTQMDIFILPSFWEGLPNVILEAMAYGVPVIATDSGGGIRDAIRHGVNGMLIKPGSPEEIAEAACDLLLNAQKRREISQAAYNVVRRYDIAEIKLQYEVLIYS